VDRFDFRQGSACGASPIRLYRVKPPFGDMRLSSMISPVALDPFGRIRCLDNKSIRLRIAKDRQYRFDVFAVSFFPPPFLRRRYFWLLLERVVRNMTKTIILSRISEKKETKNIFF